MFDDLTPLERIRLWYRLNRGFLSAAELYYSATYGAPIWPTPGSEMTRELRRLAREMIPG